DSGGGGKAGRGDGRLGGGIGGLQQERPRDSVGDAKPPRRSDADLRLRGRRQGGRRQPDPAAEVASAEQVELPFPGLLRDCRRSGENGAREEDEAGEVTAGIEEAASHASAPFLIHGSQFGPAPPPDFTSTTAAIVSSRVRSSTGFRR